MRTVALVTAVAIGGFALGSLLYVTGLVHVAPIYRRWRRRRHKAKARRRYIRDGR